MNTSGSVPLVLDLHIVHDRFGSSSDPSINAHLHYPNDLGGSLNESVSDTIRQYLTDYNNRPSNSFSFMTSIPSTSGCLHCELVSLLFLQNHRETDRFLQFQEFRLCNLTVTSSTSVTRSSPHISSLGSATFSPRLQHCGYL